MSSGVKDLWRRRNDRDYLNWLAVGDALMFLRDGLRKYAEIKMKELHALITTIVGGPGVKCHCKCTPGKKPNPHGRPTTCNWAQELKKFHCFSRKGDIPWHQSISSQWHDPVHGHWEIAKLFMSDLGKNWATTRDPSTTDGGPLLNMLIFCNHFKIQHATLEAVKDWRNKWAHAPDHTLSDMDKQDAFNAIECLINDPELVGIKDVQDCCPSLKRIETADISILQDNELNIIQEFQRILDDKDHEIKVLKKLDKLVKGLDRMGSVFLAILLFTVSSLLRKVPGILWSLMAFFMFSQVGDKTVILDYGCPIAVIKSPISHFHFQEFDFSSYLAYKREGFVGRKWFFLEMESIFEENRGIAGVLITGEPVLMSQLICSPYSSLLIHENIVGYHLCEYSEKGKRNGARFVRNLVDQIAVRLPEYSKHVKNNEQIRTELDTHCHKDPTGCFFSTIVGPLRKLKQPDSPRFIIIDALDECFESDTKTSEIMQILKNKIPHFPKWLKVILTSRNLTSVTSRLPQMQINRTLLYATDERNVNDIRFYVSRFLSQNSHFSDRLLTAMNISSRTKGMKIFLDEVISRAEGNFLFVKTTLQYMNDTGGKVDLQSLPTSLFDLYNIFFDRQFGAGGFGPFRFLFEVLLAVYSPLHSQDVEEILKNEYEATDITKLIEHVSCFLRFGRDGTVRIYHQSFAEWLINQTPVLSINKTRGHQSIAKFLLRRMRERQVDVTFGELTELFMHILSGRSLEMQETAMNLFNITKMREPQTNQSMLHYLVTKPNIYLPVLDFFLQKFQTVDILDASNKTPAFYAASEGLVRSLQSCINNGADINSFLEGYTELDPVSVVVRNAGIEEFSLMHVAVAKGHKDVVELLIKSNISFPVFSKRYPTPLHVAAANGHLQVVEVFYEFGETFDPITLHHAVARNHLEVVRFILSTVGLRDTCLQCQLEHFSQLSLKTTIIQEAHAYFCETALHAAVSRGLVDIVQILLDFGKESLECKHHSGKTVLMDAVERNDTEMVDLLLRHGANVTENCGWKISKDSKTQMCSIYSMYKQDVLYTVYCVNDSCGCGYTAIHVSAKYGLWEMAEKLISGRTEEVTDLVDCDGDSATHVAIIYDHTDFIQNINMSLNKIGQYLATSTMVNMATKYCSANVARLFLKYTVDEDENVWNLLLRSVLWSPCEAKIVSNSYCLNAFKDSDLSGAEEIKKESERRLNIIKLLIETHQMKSLVLHKEDDEMTLLHYAALNGFKDAVKYLVELGADELLTNKNGNTPLMIALEMSPVNHRNPSASYRCYTTNDGQFSLCTTSCYDETVRYLIQSQRSSISKCDHETALMLEKVIIKRMPLSLYALSEIGVDWNCRSNDFTSAMLLHLFVGGREVTEVVKIFEVDVSVKCGVSFSKSELHWISYISTSDGFGNFFKPSLNRKRFPLQRLIDRHPRGVRILDECYDAEGYLPIHRAVQGGNLDAIKWFKNIGVNTHLKTRSGLTALDISIVYLSDNKYARMYSNDLVKTSTRYRNECFEEMLRAFFDTSHKNYSSDFSSISFSKYPILHLAVELGLDVVTVVYEKALEIIPSLKKNKYLLLDEQDAEGNTPLHHAADLGLENVVKYLVQLGADINIKNKLNNTPMLIALIVESHVDHRCYTTKDGLFTSCETTPHDEIVRYLIWSQKSSISKCDDESAFLLNVVIEKQMPLSLYALLKIGVDVNCQLKNDLSSPFLRHIRKGGQQVSEVLKIFEVNVSVQCGVSSIYSELHLISYVSASGDFGNFFKPSLNSKCFPLQILIDRHPRGVRILDECYDAEGYLPIHRAIQGGNIDAIKWFKSIGANTHLETRSGLTALDISIFILGDKKYAKMYSNSLNDLFNTNTRYPNECFEEVFRAFFDTSHENNRSDFTSISFSKYHILHTAAEIGLKAVTVVYEKALEIIPSLKRNKSLLLDEQDADGNTPLDVAAYHGLENVVKYLVQLGADINIKNKLNNTPMLTALLVESYVAHRCYTTKDGLFTSCETTPHDEIVRYLIWSQKSSISKCDDESAFLLNVVIEKRMPLSLYALLKIGVDVNCQLKYELSSPFLQHIRKGGQQVSEVLKIFEVDVSVQCGVSSIYSELHLISYVSVSGDFGNFFKPSLNKKRFPLQRLIDRHPRGVRILDECYDAEGYLPIHRAVEGGNLDAIKWFKDVGVNAHLKTRSGLTAIDISIFSLGDNKYARMYSNSLNDLVKTNTRFRNECFEEVLRAFFDTSHKNNSSGFSSIWFSKYPILHLATEIGLDVATVVYEKALQIIPNLKKNKYLLLDEQDAEGNTPLHHAAYHGRENVVKYLVQLGADINIKNKFNNTAMLIALIIESHVDHHCYTTKDGLFTSCETTPHDEIVRYLIWSKKSSISKCDDESAFSLNVVIEKRMPLSLYALLKIGVDVNCQLKNELSSLFLRHITIGGQQVSEVLKMFEVDVSVQCGIPFISSELHLISYVPISGDFGNFFKPSLNKKRSPFQRLIDRHPRGVRILDECYDAEGYLPIHRAVQGGNLDAIKWFKNIGVNAHLKTRSGLTALDISILNLGNISYGLLNRPPKLYLRLLKVYWHDPMTTSKYRRKVFKKLLQMYFSTSQSEFPCGPALEGLSLLHIAAVKGMAVLRYVHKKASEIFASLPINCVNKHGLDPVYLGHFYDSVLNEGFIDKYPVGNSNIPFVDIITLLKEKNIWYNSADEIFKHGKKRNENNIDLEFGHDSVPPAQYPDREIDYFIVFNYLYEPPLPQSTEAKSLYQSVNHCPGYYDSFPKFEDAESVPESPDQSKCSKIHNDYYKLLCMLEISNKLFIHNCHLIRKLLQMRYTWRRRRNRQLSQFISKRLGWSDGYQLKNIDYRWPFYFLHKMDVKEYGAYEYLKILNEALEFADIRFSV